MAFTQLSKALHRNLQKIATQCSVQKCLLIHTHRTVSTVSRLTFYRKLETPSSVIPVLSCLIQTDRRRSISLDSTVRNKSSPEERDRSLSRYRSGSPKPSAARKGRQCVPFRAASNDYIHMSKKLLKMLITFPHRPK